MDWGQSAEAEAGGWGCPRGGCGELHPDSTVHLAVSLLWAWDPHSLWCPRPSASPWPSRAPPPRKQPRPFPLPKAWAGLHGPSLHEVPIVLRPAREARGQSAESVSLAGGCSRHKCIFNNSFPLTASEAREPSAGNEKLIKVGFSATLAL